MLALAVSLVSHVAGAEEPLKLTDGVADLIAVLHSRGQHVYFVSGGACANRPRRQTQNSLYMFPVPRNT
jgi:hypothetical protein